MTGIAVGDILIDIPDGNECAAWDATAAGGKGAFV